MNDKLVEAYTKLVTENSIYNDVDEIELEDIDVEEMLKCEYEIPVIGMVKCPECKGVFCKEDGIYESSEDFTSLVYDGFDNYHEETESVPVDMIQCPLCNYEEKLDESDFYEATTGDIIDAPNKEELLPGITAKIKEFEGRENQ